MRKLKKQKMQKNYTNATKCLKNAIDEIVAG